MAGNPRAPTSLGEVDPVVAHLWLLCPAVETVEADTHGGTVTFGGAQLVGEAACAEAQ